MEFRPRFTIRDLLLVTAVFALAAGWWIDHQRINNLAVQKWEYIKLDGYWNANTKNLNDQGELGWEVCEVTHDQNGNIVTLILKRPKH
jgi:hypothetical protein